MNARIALIRKTISQFGGLLSASINRSFVDWLIERRCTPRHAEEIALLVPENDFVLMAGGLNLANVFSAAAIMECSDGKAACDIAFTEFGYVAVGNLYSPDTYLIKLSDPLSGGGFLINFYDTAEFEPERVPFGWWEMWESIPVDCEVAAQVIRPWSTGQRSNIIGRLREAARDLPSEEKFTATPPVPTAPGIPPSPPGDEPGTDYPGDGDLEIGPALQKISPELLDRILREGMRDRPKSRRTLSKRELDTLLQAALIVSGNAPESSAQSGAGGVDALSHPEDIVTGSSLLSDLMAMGFGLPFASERGKAAEDPDVAMEISDREEQMRGFLRNLKEIKEGRDRWAKTPRARDDDVLPEKTDP